MVFISDLKSVNRDISLAGPGIFGDDNAGSDILAVVFFMMNGNKTQELHIEKIPGCKLFKKEEEITNVIVVFISKAFGSKTMRVVGFYKNATAFRYPHYIEVDNDSIKMNDVKLIVLQSEISKTPHLDDVINGYSAISILSDPADVTFTIQLRKV